LNGKSRGGWIFLSGSLWRLLGSMLCRRPVVAASTPVRAKSASTDATSRALASCTVVAGLGAVVCVLSIFEI
jgi:hypothetical protein